MADIDLAELLGGDVDLASLFGEADTDDAATEAVAGEGGGEDQPGGDDEPAATPARDEQGRFTEAGEAESDEGDASPEDDEAGAEGDSGEPTPDAEAEAAFERRYQERFAVESRKATQEAVSRLQSSLDRRYAQLDHAKRDVEAEVAVHQDVAARALAALAEFDEDAARALRAHGSLTLNTARARRQGERATQEANAQKRAAFYAEYNATPGNPYVDPNDPDLLESFRTGNRPAYEARFALLQERSRQAAAAQPKQAAAEPSPAAAKIAATREREQKRGRQPLAEGRVARPKLETFDDADKLVQRLAKNLNIAY